MRMSGGFRLIESGEHAAMQKFLDLDRRLIFWDATSTSAWPKRFAHDFVRRYWLCFIGITRFTRDGAADGIRTRAWTLARSRTTPILRPPKAPKLYHVAVSATTFREVQPLQGLNGGSHLGIHG